MLEQIATGKSSELPEIAVPKKDAFSEMLDGLIGAVTTNKLAETAEVHVNGLTARENASLNRARKILGLMKITSKFPAVLAQITAAQRRMNYADSRADDSFWGAITTALESPDFAKKSDPIDWVISCGILSGNRRIRQINARENGQELAEESLIKVVDLDKRQYVPGSGYYLYRVGPKNGIAGRVAAYRTVGRRISGNANRLPRDRMSARYYGDSPYIQPAELDEMGDVDSLADRLIKRVYLVDPLAAIAVADIVDYKLSRDAAIRTYAPYGLTAIRLNRSLENAMNYVKGEFIVGGTFLNSAERIAWYDLNANAINAPNIEAEIAAANRNRMARNLYFASKTKSIIAANSRKETARYGQKLRAASYGDMTYTRSEKLAQLTEMETAKTLAFNENAAEITRRNERIIGRLVSMGEANRTDEKAVRRAKGIQRMLRDYEYGQRGKMHDAGNHSRCAHLMDEN